MTLEIRQLITYLSESSKQIILETIKQEIIEEAQTSLNTNKIIFLGKAIKLINEEDHQEKPEEVDDQTEISPLTRVDVHYAEGLKKVIINYLPERTYVSSNDLLTIFEKKIKEAEPEVFADWPSQEELELYSSHNIRWRVLVGRAIKLLVNEEFIFKHSKYNYFYPGIKKDLDNLNSSDYLMTNSHHS